MIDKIRLSKKNLCEAEIKTIVSKSRLQQFEANGLTHYNNQKTKNFNGGFYIKIATDKMMTVEGSLHKYANFLKSKKLYNHNEFTMIQAKETYLKLIENIGFNPVDAIINYYEIGINIATDIKPKDLLKNIYSIGDFDKEKIFLIDPRHKDKSQKTTSTHRDFRVIYKTYDKIHEMQDNRKFIDYDKNIIRLETTRKRVEKTMLIDFFEETNLIIIRQDFFRSWDKLNFVPEIDAPPKTNIAKIELAKILHRTKPVEVLAEIKKEYLNKSMTKSSYYTLKSFIENWETKKIQFKTTKSKILSLFGIVYNTEKQKYN